ncbi:GGDEF domain-containing protein [bacterium]|nr:GGDEF domain-containing protein [bacterium]
MKQAEKVESLILQSENLPTLPGIALKIIAAYQKPDPDIQQIGDLLTTDPPLTFKILKIVNSSFYSLPTKITSVHHAIKLLGIKAIKNLALCFTLINTFQSNKYELIDYRRFWKNSLVGASATKLIAEKLVPDHADDAFILGLLQDIGILIFGYCMPKQYALVLNEVGKNANIYPQVETQVLGINHQEIGEYLTKSWDLPNTFYLPIGYHHIPEKLPSAQSSILELTKILHLSSLFIDLLNDKNRAMSLWKLKETVNHFGFSAEIDVNQIWDKIYSQIQQIFPIFDIEIGQDEYIQIIESAKAELSKLSVEMINNYVHQDKEIRTLKEQVVRDSMTQLYNHHHFRQLLQSELARAKRYNRPLSLLFGDIDNFKAINDTYGHLAGDRIIKALATKLRMETRDSDHVARYGGEEFAVILTETTIEDAKMIAERLRSEIESMDIMYGDNSISITLSFGIAELTDNKQADIDELISRADKASYQAKEQGKNRCVIAD